jgi:hypothetical protein
VHDLATDLVLVNAKSTALNSQVTSTDTKCVRGPVCSADQCLERQARVPAYVTRAYWRGEGIWMEVSGHPHAPAALPLQQPHPYSLNRRLGGLQSRSGHFGEDK